MPEGDLEKQIKEQISGAALGPREPGEEKRSKITAPDLGRMQEIGKQGPVTTPQPEPQPAPREAAPQPAPPVRTELAPGGQPEPPSHRENQQDINRVSQQGRKYPGRETKLPPGQKPSLGKKAAKKTAKTLAKFLLPTLGTGGITGAIAYFLS